MNDLVGRRGEAAVGQRGRRVLLYSHDTFGLGHLRRSRTIAQALTAADPALSALIMTGSPIAGRFDFAERIDHVRLPGVVKQPDGSYTSLNLNMPIDQMVQLRGAIIAAGGGKLDPSIYRRFVQLAGGPEARVVVIPTAGTTYGGHDGWRAIEDLRAVGVEKLEVLHTRSSAVAVKISRK